MSVHPEQYPVQNYPPPVVQQQPGYPPPQQYPPNQQEQPQQYPPNQQYPPGQQQQYPPPEQYPPSAQPYPPGQQQNPPPQQYVPQQGGAPPAYPAQTNQVTVINQPGNNIVLHGSGDCPRCKQADMRTNPKWWAWLTLVFCFPCGIICFITCNDHTCPKCGLKQKDRISRS